jgi:hypothetical protein
LGQNPRWRTEVSAEERKSQYLTSRLTDHHKILTAASYHHQKPGKSTRFRFGRKYKMAAGNETKTLKSLYLGYQN